MKYLLLALLTLPIFATAQEDDEITRSVSSVSNEQIQEKAKRRQYAGAQDESDLKVQPQIVKPSRKFAPVIEEPGDSTSQDND